MVRITISFLLILCVSCTTSSQRIAQQSMEIGLVNLDMQYRNVGRLARQNVLDNAAYKIQIAVKNGSSKDSEKVVQELFDDMQNLNTFDIQYERGRSLTRKGYEYIVSRQGALSLLLKEWKQAEDSTK